ncbi:glycosyltransferase family 4 protein [Geothrix sp. 21YS21S-2]|uniref:glycosyltransferase family 4 protein n=1 Tax=Geothrix sp. 21YS21S-2 TaxID=3068893 RepID=UPI0027B968F0|nr:glycosyltransferase family 4 protein [Geothrix sp. 21YS21S-2]
MAIFVNHLIDGGAARVAVNLARAWSEQGRRVTILTSDSGEHPPFYELDPRVAHLPLGLRSDSSNILDASWSNIWRLIRLRRALKAIRPDILVSFLDRNNVLSLLASRGMSGLPVIVSERTDPSGRSIGRAWNGLRRLAYPWADCVVVQTTHALNFFSRAVRSKGRVIPNPVVLPPADPEPGPRGPRRVAITLGRLSKVKGHDMLIQAFAAIAGDFPDWDLAIYGEGPERRALEGEIQSYGLGDRILLKGATEQVGGCLRAADLFVFPSRTEGFPNALAEAMACGLPVVSFDCESGPSELIRDGSNGLLVPPQDVPAFSRSMARLMASPEERTRMGAAARDVLERFSEDRVMEMWESAIQAAIRARGIRSAS